MQCRQCGSDNVQRLQVIFESGTQNAATSGFNHALGDLLGHLRLRGTITSTQGISQSLLASRATPPAKRPLTGSVITLLLGLLCVSADGWLGGLGVLLLGIGAYRGYRARQFNTKLWPLLYQQWLDSWLCHKCGSIGPLA